MARILFSCYSNIVWLDGQLVDPFYMGFLKSLADSGNDVLFIRTNDFIDQFDNNQWNMVVKDSLLSEVKNFSPELIITANNSLPCGVLQHTNCPVLLYSADAPAHYASPKSIKENLDRYTFMHGWNHVLGDACVSIFGSKPEQNYYAGYYTVIQSEACQPRNNISFIGFLGWPQCGAQKFYATKNQDELIRLLYEFDEKTHVIEKWDSSFLSMLTFAHRVRTLDAICDLGLKIYGIPSNIMAAAPFSLGIIRCFDFMSVVTSEKTQEILNATKIAPTLYNAQAPGGLSWRVADVMASNACLISTPKEDLKRISPYVAIPTYTSPLECRELCKKLLSDDIWRKDVVEGAHKAVEEFCRFPILFKELEQRFGMTIISHRAGSIVWAMPKYKWYGWSLRYIKQTATYKALKQTRAFSLLKKVYRSVRPYANGG